MPALSPRSVGVDARINGVLDLLAATRSCQNIEEACLLLESFLKERGITLLSVKFCDIDDRKPAIRPFGRYPCAISQLSVELRESGGCPLTREAVKQLAPFDALAIDDRKYPDFLSKRFLQELRKLDHSHIAVIPVVLGHGLMLVTAGLGDHDFKGTCRDLLVGTVCSFSIAIVHRFNEAAALFESEVLSRLEARVLFLFCSGFSPGQIPEIIDLSEVTVAIILRNVIRKLGAANIGEAVAKALAMGEIGNLQSPDDVSLEHC